MVAPRPFVLALALGACATSGVVADPTMATIGAKGAVVDSIDAHNVRDETAGARFEIPAGRHTVEISLPVERADAAPTDENVPVIAVCFEARAGRHYLAQPVVGGGRWRPEIVDADTGEGAAACGTQGSSAVVESAAPPPSSIETSLPVPGARPHADPDKPGNGLDVGLGFFFGGDSLYDVTFINAPNRSLSAGRGMLVSLGGLWTPLWVEEKVGFGVGANVGWKYDSIEAANGTVSLRRFPLNLSVHSLIPLNQRWFGLVRGGLVKELGGHISGSGFAAAAENDISSTWGLVGEAGLFLRIDRAALGAGLRYSRLHDHFQGVRVNASSLGIVGSGHYNF